MAIPSNKSELLAAIEKDYEALKHELDKITPDQSTEISMVGHANDTQMSINNLTS